MEFEEVVKRERQQENSAKKTFRRDMKTLKIARMI